jgi:ATPase subunit of ABC transporter with duplicated ATPase domains
MLSTLSIHVGYRKHPLYSIDNYAPAKFLSHVAAKEKYKNKQQSERLTKKIELGKMTAEERKLHRAQTEAKSASRKASTAIKRMEKTKAARDAKLAKQKRETNKTKKKINILFSKKAEPVIHPRQKFGNVLFGLIHTPMGYIDKPNIPYKMI